MSIDWLVTSHWHTITNAIADVINLGSPKRERDFVTFKWTIFNTNHYITPIKPPNHVISVSVTTWFESLWGSRLRQWQMHGHKWMLFKISTSGMHCLLCLLWTPWIDVMHSIFYLVCESGRVVGDKMEVCLKQIQVAVMHILKEQTQTQRSWSVNTGRTLAFWIKRFCLSLASFLFKSDKSMSKCWGVWWNKNKHLSIFASDIIQIYQSKTYNRKTKYNGWIVIRVKFSCQYFLSSVCLLCDLWA